MRLEEAIAAIEGCATEEALSATLQSIAEAAGFKSYRFIQTGDPFPCPIPAATENGLEVAVDRRGTLGSRPGPGRDAELGHSEACLREARGKNRPFPWARIRLSKRNGSRPAEASRPIEVAAEDAQEAILIPFSYCDDRGNVRQGACAFVSPEAADPSATSPEKRAYELHLVLLYWIQRAFEIRAPKRPPDDDKVITLDRGKRRGSNGPLSDRERNVIAWAARGKTMAETAEIMKVSSETVQSHLKNSVKKLGAANKIHAVAKAVHLNLVSI